MRLSKTKLKRLIKEELRIAIALHENADLMQNATLLNIRDFGYIPEDPNFDQKAEAEPAFGDIKRHLEADEGAIAIAKSGSKYVFIMLGLSEPHGPNEVRSVGHVDSRYTSAEKALQMFKDHAEKFVDDEVAKNAVMNTTLEDLDNLQNEDMLVVKSKKKVSDTLSWLQSLSAQPVEKSSSKSEDRYHDEPYHHQPGLVGGAARHRKRVSKYYKESKLTKSNIKDLIKEEFEATLLYENPVLKIGELIDTGMTIDSIASAFAEGDALGTGINVAALVSPHVGAALYAKQLKDTISNMAGTYLKRKAAAKKKAELLRRKRAKQAIARGEVEAGSYDLDTGEVVWDAEREEKIAAQRMRAPKFRSTRGMAKRRPVGAPTMAKINPSKFKKIVREELRSVMIEEGLWDNVKKAYNAPGRLASRVANKIYDMTASKDVPTMAVGPADKVSKMKQPWEYEEATQDEKTKFDVAMAIAGLLSLGLGAAAAGGGAAKKAAGQTALKQYLTDKAIDAPAIAAGTYASYQLAMQKAGKKPVGKQRFEAAKAALKNIAIEALPGNKAIGIGAKTSATAAG